MSDIFPEQPITSLPAAVAFMGALPVPVGPVPQQLSADRLAEIRSLDLLALMDDRVAPVISGHLAVLVAEIGRLEHTVRQMVEGLNGHDCPPPDEAPMQAVTRFAVRLMEAERLLAEDGCSCPPADHPHQVGCPLDLPTPGSPERPVNELTQSFAPVAALREDLPLKGRARLDASAARDAEATHWKRLGIEDPHDSPPHHGYRVGHDLPELGGAL
jgi:hypothetical protein